jgi:hypothetical protein
MADWKLVLKFSLSILYGLFFGVFMYIIIDTLMEDYMQKSFKPIMAIALSGVGVLVKFQWDRMIKRFEAKLDKVIFDNYIELEKERYEETKTLIENISKQNLQILDKLN